MNEFHTKARLRFEDISTGIVNDGLGYLYQDDGSLKPTIAHTGDANLTVEENRANARRLVACWNSCQGIPTEMLEQIGELIVKGAIPYHKLLTRATALYDAAKYAQCTCSISERASGHKVECWMPDLSAAIGDFLVARGPREKADGNDKPR